MYIPSWKRPTVYASRRLPIFSTLFTVPFVLVTAVSSVEISLSRSSSDISGRTMNITSYVRFIRLSPNLSLGRVRLRVVFWLAVEAVHRRIRTFGQNHCHCVGGGVQNRVHHRELPLRERLQNSRLRRDPQPDPHKLFRAQRPDDRLHPVVPGGTAALADANRAHRQIQLVVNHDQVCFRSKLVLVEQLLHRDAAQVHESLWLCQ